MARQGAVQTFHWGVTRPEGSYSTAVQCCEYLDILEMPLLPEVCKVTASSSSGSKCGSVGLEDWMLRGRVALSGPAFHHFPSGQHSTTT